MLKYRSCDSALAIVSSSPSAVDSAAASPPAATRQLTANGMPPISGAASTRMSGVMRNSPSCSTPSWLMSTADTSDGCVFDHSRIQRGSSENGVPTTEVNTSYFTSTASTGAHTYSNAMNSSAQVTERRAAETLGVV